MYRRVLVRQILEQAKSFDAPLIALRTHGRRGLERLVAGSVAENVIRYSDRPVLLLHGSPVEAHARRSAPA